MTSEGTTVRLTGKGWISMAGVCSADPQHIACWQPDGSPAPKLTELLNAYYLVNQQQHLEIRYKRRSLMLVFQYMLSSTGGHSVNFGNIAADPGGSIYNQGTISYGGTNEETTNYYWYYPSDDLKTVDLTANLNETTEGGKLELKVGASLRMAGGTLTITKIQSAPADATVNPGYVDPNRPKGPMWSVAYDLKPDGTNPITSVYATPFDEEGAVISQVDDRGNPKKPTRGNQYGQMGYMGAGQYPIISQNQNGWLLRVQPSKVAYLTVSGTSVSKLDFKGVALQPAGRL